MPFEIGTRTLARPLQRGTPLGRPLRRSFLADAAASVNGAPPPVPTAASMPPTVAPAAPAPLTPLTVQVSEWTGLSAGLIGGAALFALLYFVFRHRGEL